MSKMSYDSEGREIDPNYESVAQFIVEMNWGPDGYYGDQSFVPGLHHVKIVIDGVGTSTEAIEKAKELLKSVRVDEPRTTKAELKTSKRRIPKKVGNGSTIV